MNKAAVFFALCQLSFVLPAWADTTLTVEVDGSEKTLDAISTSYSSKKYWGAKVSSDPNGVVSSVRTTYTNSKKSSTSTTIKISGKAGTAKVVVFYSSNFSPTSGTTANTITINAKSPPPPEEVEVAVHETKSFDFTWTADSNAQYWQVIVNSGSANATATVDNPGDRNTSPQGVKVVSNTITITGVAVGTASFTVQNKSTSGNPWANFKTYNVTVTNPYTVIPTPAAETGLVYDGESHQGVKAGEHYTLGGTYEATNAGDYTATVTPKSGYCWESGSTAAKTVKWTIARRPATVTVVNTNKVEGAVFIDPDQQAYNDPIWTTTAEGLIASDTTALTWDIFRTNDCEEVGTYDLLVEGEKEQGNYELTFVGGKYEICEAPPKGPTIPDDEGGLVYDPDLAEVVVTPNAGVSEVEIVNMPEDATATVPVTIDAVKGVEPTKIKVVHTTSDGTPYDITRAFAIAGDAASGVTIALDGAASVEIPLAGGGSETVTVEPRLTESGDKAIEPFEVDTGEVDVGVRTIPGLTYALRRASCLVPRAEWDDENSGVVDERQAEGLRTKLSDPMDGGKPEKAFYIIEVKK